MRSKNIGTDYIDLYILDHQTILVEAKEGVEVTAQKSMEANQRIEAVMKNDYALIINRNKDHSIDPIDVYNELNSLPGLKAMAIVVHNTRGLFPLSSEKFLFKGELEAFRTVEDARDWINRTLSNSESSSEHTSTSKS